MDGTRIKEEVISIINQSQQGLEIENPKVDCKRKWYDFKIGKDASEFLKDCSSIANTVGLDGYIIIGFDDKTKEIFNASFKDSGLRDTSDLNNQIAKNVSRPFDCNVYDFQILEHQISVLHIPPSLDKPHVITCYKTFTKEGDVKNTEQHRIFVRKGTGTALANKHDLELMYYDRKNIFPEYKLIISMEESGTRLEPHFNSFQNSAKIIGLSMESTLIIENIGRRPVAITEIAFTRDAPGMEEKLNMYAVFYTGLIIPANHISTQRVTFRPTNFNSFNQEQICEIQESFTNNINISSDKTMKLSLSNNHKISEEFIIY